jgi:hypothetical protein
VLRLALIALAGCQWVYGLDKPDPAGAAPPDGPWTCPAIGGEPMTFSKEIHEYISRNCVYYQRAHDTERAIAQCGGAVEEGVIDGDLHVVVQLDPSSFIEYPRLTPEGYELWIVVYDQTLMLYRLVAYTRDGTGTWSETTPPMGITIKPGAQISSPTRKDIGPRHVVVNDNTLTLSDYKDSGAGWTVVHSYSASDLGVMYIEGGLWMSSDGLRMMFAGFTTSYALYYTDRDTIDGVFRPGQPMPDAPFAQDPFLTDNCGQLFVSGLGAIFYAPKT